MQIRRYLDLVELDGREQVVLVLAPAQPRSSNHDKRWVIREQDLWKFSEELNDRDQFCDYMFSVCARVYELFDLGDPSVKDMAEVATCIQSGIDELLSAIGDTTEAHRNPEIIGEAKMVINGVPCHYGVTASGLLLPA